MNLNKNNKVLNTKIIKKKLKFQFQIKYYIYNKQDIKDIQLRFSSLPLYNKQKRKMEFTSIKQEDNGSYIKQEYQETTEPDQSIKEEEEYYETEIKQKEYQERPNWTEEMTNKNREYEEGIWVESKWRKYRPQPILPTTICENENGNRHILQKTD